MTTNTARAITLLALGALVAGCAAAAGGTTKRSPPIAEQEPLSPAQQRGEALFMKYCNACHPQGEGGIGGTLNTKPFPEAALRLKVRTGLGLDMPSFSEEELPEPDLDHIVEYVQTLRTNDPIVDNPEEIEAPSD
jgi:mono/diheme cytochrome c family protein